MGKLTQEVFNESCCDGGSILNGLSAQPCGCDFNAKWICERHREAGVRIEVEVEEDHEKLIEWVKGLNPRREVKVAEVRTFETGATRDLDDTKLDLEGFESPLVMTRFAEFMHANRLQKDGKLRDSDNWQKGIPKKAYMKSMMRHFMDVWLHHRGFGNKAKEPLEVALCALRFNVNGYLDTILKEKGLESPR